MPKCVLKAILSILLLFIACTTKDGEIASFNPTFGSIFVSSTVPGARIFLDYEDTGLSTPALVNDVRVGRHIVHVFLSRYRPDVDSIIVDVKEGEETSINFELINVPTVGNLNVTTNPDSALVTINRLEFGYTPLKVIGLQIGTYNLEIIKSGYAVVESNIRIVQNQTREVSENLSVKRLVLFEHYSNTDCAPCVEVDEIIEAVVNELGPFEVVSLGYHPNIPSPNDPFYLEARPENDARKNYYSVPFAPFAIIDGVEIIQTTQLSELEQNIIDAVNERQGIRPKAIIEIFDIAIAVDTVSGRIKVTALENLGNNNTLRIALINRTIDRTSPPGTNGQTHFFDVLRDMYPDAQGVSITLSANEKQSVPFKFVRQPSWQDDLEVIAFLQNDVTKEVLQSAWTVSP